MHEQPEPENPRRNHAGRWQPGSSGNPAGKPRGCRHKATEAALELLEHETLAITRTAIERALDGDMVAVRLVLERVIPVVRERPVRFDVPPLESAKDLPAAVAGILEAVADGELTVGDGARLAVMVRDMATALEVNELEQRIAELEARHANP